MSDEDLRRAIEFLVAQQSRYSARLERDKPQLARLEEAFVTLAELARDADKKPTLATLSKGMNDLAKSMITLAETQAKRDCLIGRHDEHHNRSPEGI